MSVSVSVSECVSECAFINNDIGAATRLDKTMFFNVAAHDIGFHALDDATRWGNIVLQDLMHYPVCV